MSGRRWEEDERGEGIGDASSFAPAAAELVDAMQLTHWVAEQPEVHLLPHLQRACESLPLQIVSMRENHDGSFEVTLRWTRADFRNGEVRAAIFSLIGSFAEISTYVRQRSGDAPGGTLSFDVVTGFLDGESPYDPHGHTVRIAVSL